MDVLLSLPLVSYFFSSAITSWTASFNILFFYMTWSTFVLSHSPLAVHVFGVLAIRTIFWLIPSLITLGFDVSVPSVAESLKFDGKSALPPRNANELGKMLLLALVNLVIAIAVEGGISLVFETIFKTPEFTTNLTLPLPWQIFKHTLLILTTRETLGYYIHRFVLHGRSSIEGQHRRYAHGRPSAPFSLQLFVDHPLPSLLYRLVPLYLPALLLRPHILTYFLIVALCTIEETLSMSGYTVVPGIIMSGIVQRSSMHYKGQGTSNFGTYGLIDWAHGTGRGRQVLDDVAREADKHHVKDKLTIKADKRPAKIKSVTNAAKDKSLASADEGMDRSRKGTNAVTRSVKRRKSKVRSTEKAGRGDDH